MKKSKVALAEVVAKVDSTLSDKDRRMVMGSLRDAGFADAITAAQMDLAIQVAKQAVATHKEISSRYNPLIDGAAKSEQDVFTVDKCPLCSSEMKAVTLIGNRNATFCNLHNVVYPSVDKKEKQ